MRTQTHKWGHEHVHRKWVGASALMTLAPPLFAAWALALPVLLHGTPFLHCAAPHLHSSNTYSHSSSSASGGVHTGQDSPWPSGQQATAQQWAVDHKLETPGLGNRVYISIKVILLALYTFLILINHFIESYFSFASQMSQHRISSLEQLHL